jgi:putative oxidoreductase
MTWHESTSSRENRLADPLSFSHQKLRHIQSVGGRENLCLGDTPMSLFRTHRNWAALFCRIVIAAVFIPHGLDKLLVFEPFGWTGPETWAKSVCALIKTEAIPMEYKLIMAQASAWAEVVAGVSCLIGFLVRLTVLPLIIDMGVAIMLIHGRNGFWIQHQPGAGFEYNMVLILVCLGLFFSGAGSISLDKLISSEPDYYDHYGDDDEYDEHAPGPDH